MQLTASSSRIGWRERLQLAAQRVEGPAPERPSLSLLTREASYLVSPLTRRLRRAPRAEKARNPKIILMLPGFISTPVTLRYLAQNIERAGHKTKRWKLGFNTGPSPERIAFLEERLLEVREYYGVKPILLGWSLGGLFARELAKRQPDAVSKVITLGSPFSGDPRANNAWRLYQFVTGHAVDNPPVGRDIHVKPPVETVAFWSPRDGVIAPRSARGKPEERDREVSVRCTHMGYSYEHGAIEAVLQELQRD